MQQDKKSKVETVIDRVQKSKNIPLPLKGKLIDKLIRRHDLDLSESNLIYDNVDFGEEFKLLGKRPAEINWSNHAEFRSELRDIDSEEMNKFIEKEMTDKIRKNDLKGDERLKEPGLGTAVVDYDLRKPKVNVITVFSNNIKKGEIMDFTEQKILGFKYGKLISKKVNYDPDEAIAFCSNAILTSLLFTIENDESQKESAFIKRLAKLRIFLSKYYKSSTGSVLTLSKFKTGISTLQQHLDNDIVAIFLTCYNIIQICGITECNETAKTLIPFAKLYSKTSETIVTSSDKQANIVSDFLNNCGSVHEAIGEIIDKLTKDKKYIESMGAISSDVQKIDNMINELTKVELKLKKDEKDIQNKKLLISE